MTNDASEFVSMKTRLVGEAEERLANAKRVIPYNHGFLDDTLQGIFPHDLILIGAPTGAGKTQFALGIATATAMAGKRVACFALEAEPRELERRTKYGILANMLHREHAECRDRISYSGWLRGQFEQETAHLSRRVESEAGKKLATMHTYYRGENFTQETLRAQVLSAAVWADLVVIDHLHYIDLDAGQSEVTGYGEVIKTVRNLALSIGRPVIVVAHLRKRDKATREVIADIDDFHGSSNITKICTQVITLAPASGVVKPDKFWLAPTFVRVVKDRREGAKPLVALCQFDMRIGAYQSDYTLGILGKDGKPWAPIESTRVPPWAHHHQLADIEYEGEEKTFAKRKEQSKP